MDLTKCRGLDARHLLGVEVHVRYGYETGLELVPEGCKVVVVLEGLLQAFLKARTFFLGLPHLQPQGALLVLKGRESPLTDFQLLAQFRKRRFVVLEFNCHYLTQYLSIRACLIPVSAGEKYFAKSLQAVSSISVMVMFTSIARSSRA